MMASLSVEVRTVPGTVKCVGRVYYEFMASVAGREPQPFVMQMPMDRRQARRVSRRTGRPFRLRDGQPVFGKASR